MNFGYKFPVTVSSRLLFTVVFVIIFSLNAGAALPADTLRIGNSYNAVAQGDSAQTPCDTLSAKAYATVSRGVDFIGGEPYSIEKDSVTKEEYDFDDFRFFGDVFRYHFPAFTYDFGSFGQPHEINFYGLGTGEVSALYDGVAFESPHTGYADFNRFQINGISSVNLSSLPRGFLFGRSLNPVSVNFNSFEEFSRVAHTRIFYFQGANDEAMINIYFHKGITKKLYVTFDLSNAMISPEYRNSDYDTWNGSIKLTYLADSTLSASFLFSRYRAVTKLYGGVDVDSLERQYGSDYEEYFYNGYLAPVLYPDREMTTEWNNYVFTVNKNFSKEHKFQIKFSLADYFTRYSETDFGKLERTAYSFGFYELRDRYENDVFCVEGKMSGYANFTHISPYLYDDVHTLTVITSLKLSDGKIVPSFYGRTLRQSHKNYGGAGADVTAQLSDAFSLYGGASYYSKPYLPEVNDYIYLNDLSKPTPKVFTAEFGAHYKSENINVKVSGFAYNNDAENFYYEKTDGTAGIDFAERQIYGAYLNGSLRFGFLLLQFNYTYLDNSLNNLQVSPEYVLNAGVFYYGRLFENNLLMKSGINFYFTGKQNYFYRDFYNARSFWFSETDDFRIVPFSRQGSPDAFTMDFFFVGRIQDRANIYFVFENLLDKKYFIVPYYPKQSRSVRIGISWDLYD